MQLGFVSAHRTPLTILCLREASLPDDEGELHLGLSCQEAYDDLLSREVEFRISFR